MDKRIALFFDIDGTLLDNKTKSILPLTQYILEELNKKTNYDLYLSTGRSLGTLGKIAPYKKYFKGMNLSNGQEIYIGEKAYFGTPIAKETIKKLLMRAEVEMVSIGLILKNEIVMNFFTNESHFNFIHYVQAKVTNLNHKPFDFTKDVLQVWLFASNEIIQTYREVFPNLDFIDWGGYGADVLPHGVSKANGIQKIANLIGYEKANMYAFGDGDNDAPMFEVVGTSVAMGNGSILAKKKATMITDESSNDGLYKAIMQLKLLD